MEFLTNGNGGMLHSLQTNGSLNQSDSANGAEALAKIRKLKQESMENMEWAAAQGLAMAKMKVFHAMAKSVNDQQ